MDAPTQQFPPWLTPVPSVFTDPNGVEMTSTSVEFLPLTYLGPSIPLGSLYTFGGSTEPATIVTGTPTDTTSATTSTTSTEIPTTSSLSSTTAIPSTTSATSLSSSISLSTSSSLTSMLSSSSATPTSSSSSSSFQPSATVPPPASVGGLSKGQLIGVIVASILGFIFLFVFALALYLWCKGRPNRQSRTRFSMITPIDQDYLVVGPGGRTPGEGSPRHSGEEQDPFLQRSQSGRGGGATAGAGAVAGAAAAGEMKTVGEMGSLPPRSPTRVPPPPVGGTQGSNSTGSSGSSGYGTMLAHRTSSFPPPPIDEEDREIHANDYSQRRGRILTPEQISQLEEENVLPRESADQPRSIRSVHSHEEGEHDVHAYTALLPPPRLVDPETASYKPTPSVKPYASQQSIDNEEAATLLTARRVKVENLGPRNSPQRSPFRERVPPELGGSTPGSGFLGSLGLGSLAGLGRLSWFRNMDSPRHSTHTPSFTPVPLSDADLETGRSMLAAEKTDSQGSRNFGVGLGPDGVRPVSNVSGRSNASGGTVYHDAYSSVPGTPGSRPGTPGTPGLLVPPRALTPAATPPVPAIPQDTRWPSMTTMVPSTLEDVPSRQASGNNLTERTSPTFDVLDMPAPAAITNFGSASSSLRDTASGSTVGLRAANPFPPGLELLSPKAWTELSSGGTTASPNSFSIVPSHDNEAGISIDVLEEAPPSAGEGWRTIAAAAIGDHTSRRTTFGLPQVIHPPVLNSEQGSLHSMRSHLSSPTRSAGSSPAAVRDGSLSSGSNSHPSRSGSSGYSAHSLGRTGSVTSDGRRRHGPISPALSAFGPRQRPHDSDILESPPPSAHFAPTRGSTMRTSGTGSTGPDMSIL